MSSDKWPQPDLKSEPVPVQEGPGPLPRPSFRSTGVFIGIVLVGLVVAWLIGSGESDQAEVGQPAPDFMVELIDGGSFTLSEQLERDDRPIVVNLWASWCLPCREEVPEISAFSQDHPDVNVIGVAVEDAEDASIEFAEEFSPSYDLALGTPDFEAAYPRIGLPITYVIDPDGSVAEAFNGILNRSTLEDLVFG